MQLEYFFVISQFYSKRVQCLDTKDRKLKMFVIKLYERLATGTDKEWTCRVAKHKEKRIEKSQDRLTN